MTQDQTVAMAGDKLHDILQRVMLALANDEPSQVRQILDREGRPALRAWGLARGHEVPSRYDFSPPQEAAAG